MPYSQRLEARTVYKMILIYCRSMHGTKNNELCPECSQLMAYARQRIEKCPWGENKPVCSECKVHCYKPEKRENIKVIMRFSGPRMLTRSPLLAVRHMFRKYFGPDGSKLPPRSTSQRLK